MNFKKILLVPLDRIDKKLLEKIGAYLEKAFGRIIAVGKKLAVSRSSYNPVRNQYHSAAILEELLPRKSRSYERVLGISDVDLYAPGLNFVFGEADIFNGTAVISLARLRQEFYNLEKDEAIFIERVIKEAVHELGHTYGLGHCPDPKCVMYFSNSLKDTDIKGKEFCDRCKGRIEIT